MSILDAQNAQITHYLDTHHEALVSLRRTLHQEPELSRAEVGTTRMLAERLRALGYAVCIRPEGVGLIADLDPTGYSPAIHPTVAIRADMDALPIQEQSDVPYRSQRPGIMHACGHDVHVTCTMGALSALAELREELPGRLRIIYQHAEEVAPSGAPELIAFGAMEGVEAIVALHCDPELPVGTVGLRVGALCASFDRFEFTIRGKGGHGARPHHCVDPIVTGVTLCQALYAMTARSFDAREAMVLSIGEFHAGHAPNVIPQEARLTGTVRTVSNAQRDRVEQALRQIADHACGMYGASYELDLYRGAPAIINHAGVVEQLHQAAIARLGSEESSVRWLPLPSMGAEDFSNYLNHAPGAMFRLGTSSPQVHESGQEVHLLHSPRFDIDERAIGHGAAILAGAALRLLHLLAEDREALTR